MKKKEEIPILPPPIIYHQLYQHHSATLPHLSHHLAPSLPHRSQHLSCTTVTQLPISTINHHIIPHRSQQLNYTPMDHCLPLISTI